MSWAIRAFVGANGGGKSLAAVDVCALKAWQRDRPVVSNLQLYPEAVGFDADLAVRLTSWRQLPELRGCTVILDEISSVLPSRQFNSVPPQLLRVMNQLRKVDVELCWTAPNWARADVMLREVTQVVTVCRGLVPTQFHRESSRSWWPRKLRDDDGKPMRVQEAWLPNRLFVWKTYDAIELDEFTYGRVKDVRPLTRRTYWRSRHDAHRAYRTGEGVELLDHLDDVGICVGCGGQRSRPRCKCVTETAGGTPSSGRAVGPLTAAPEVPSVEQRVSSRSSQARAVRVVR